MLSDKVPEFVLERPCSTIVQGGELRIDQEGESAMVPGSAMFLEAMVLDEKSTMALEGESASPVSAGAGGGTQWTVRVFYQEAELVSLKS
jgi:hypothetical protein